MYEHSAVYYDLLYRELKNYRQEAAELDSILRKFSPVPKRLLDVGCGTGSHARELALTHGYLVDGLDIQSEFVKIAQLKSPNASFTTGDMRAFDLGRKYDAILCLFSSLGYVETLEGLRGAMNSFSRHLKPGGTLVCEPWLTADTWTPGLVDVTTASDPTSGLSIVRTRTGETEGRVSILKIEYEIFEASGHKHFIENHRLGLFENEEIEFALESAGFECQWKRQALQNGRMLQAKLVAKCGQK